ncbi:MAG: lipid-binding SYLF domain-containing protein [gamma proteobacterium symbiont of Bathyaustriella thionipta]|nr:lipid-binding SYLF domain-containing protein [gamma proteobacterium symbiont of Bathyaustriella thionipta]MCU7949393.1 lipid-binding SYLF domain-containing protein [gamma proteobacterium symbiont of Bathyaustriella thionipta]MCU7953598.1 lipid-binding SYLF domain-containing protein [gamma proteobacterium symbiont of Bathyaustriella thionipta]MCU7958102.1 lipid-binding SYLF domain-containing protein [gamma proteobacterium symbiont of Bathyaustriella thionipta]MCU7966581.1 lipid-binding SYLF d
MKKALTTLLVSLLLLIFSDAWAWDANAELKANETVAHFANKDRSLDNFFKQAYGYAVFPTIGKAGFIVGGAHGDGVVYKQGVVTGTTKMTQVSVGWQAGAEAYSEIIFFQNKSAYEDFIKGNYEIGAQASAVAAKKGVASQTKYSNGIAIFTDYKGGLMAAASVGGQKFSYEAKQ